MHYWLIVNTTTGAIGTGTGGQSPDASLAPAGYELVDCGTTLDATHQAVFADPASYTYINNAFVFNQYIPPKQPPAPPSLDDRITAAEAAISALMGV